MSHADVRACEGTRRHIKAVDLCRQGSGVAVRKVEAPPAIPVRARNSLFRQKNSLFSERTGNRLQAIELTWRLSKPLKEVGILRQFGGIPC